MNQTQEILDKLVQWDLVSEYNDSENSTNVIAYRQLQDYFKNFFTYFNDITRISKQLGTVVDDFSGESDRIGQVAEFLNQGVAMQTADIKRCMEFIKDFTDKINSIYQSSQDIITLAYEMENTNKNVSNSVDQLVVNQGKNDEAIEDILGVMKNLVVKTQKIGEVTNLINRISSETNLLGLNAKVEAAHAGIYGRGFSVVADEIQRLSKDTKDASLDISDTIKSVTDEISLLEKVAVKAKEAFSTQRETVGEVKSAFEKDLEFINTYISEQKKFNTAIEVIKGEEDRLVSAVSNILASVRNVSATANEITSLTYDQNNIIALLCKLDGDLTAGIKSVAEKSKNIKIQEIQKSRKKIAIVFDHDNPFFDPTIKEAKKAAGAYDYQIAFHAPKSRGKDGITEMIDILDSIIEEKVDGLVISPLDDEQISQRLKQINRMGTKIVFINSKLEGIDYVSFIQTNGIAAGEAGAKIVIGALGNEGEVIVNSWADIHIAAIEERKNGFVQALKKNTRIKVNEVPVNSKPSSQEADKEIKAMLTKYPGARYIFLTNCDWGLIFSEYMKKHRPDIEVITVDFTKEIQDAMNNGLIHYAIGQRNYSWGSMAFSFLDKGFKGKQAQRYVDTGTYEVNQQNINIYKSLLAG